MIVIVEGPDGAGKTTFARGFGGRYHHEGPPPGGEDSLLPYYFRMVEEAASFHVTTVFDRLALGELVYGPVLRRTSRLTPAQYAGFVRYTKARFGAVHVMCLPPMSACRQNWAARAGRGEELIGASRADVFERTYAGFSAQAHLSDLVYDYTREEAR